MSFWSRLLARLTAAASPGAPEPPGTRTRGRPPSGNGASSMHLFWDLPDTDVTEVAATLTILDAPVVDRLYFWALQASFQEGGRTTGAGHLGLQWGVGNRPTRAVNWGGYASAGGELAGSVSSLPSRFGNVNTRDYQWRARTPYRLRIFLAEPGRWRGEVTDLSSGSVAVVRDLHCPGDRLAAPMVWSEVFATCDDPPVRVRWSELHATTSTGEVISPAAVSTNYQSYRDGGCSNTTARTDGPGAVVQLTASPRELPAGTSIPL